MTRQTPADLLTIIRSFVPDMTKPIATVRKDFSAFYDEFQEDAAESAHWDLIEIRPDLPAYRITVPESTGNRTVLFFHGGGFNAGSTGDHLGLCARIARASKATVFSVDYRLAPEHPFPAAVEDAVAAYQYLIEMDVGAHRIIPVGISAGGTIVLGLLLALRDRKLPMPVGAACMSPMVDMNFSGESVVRNRESDWISAARLANIRATYLAGHDPTDPLASPIAARLNGLPRLYLQAGTHELLFDSISAFVEKTRWAGVPVQFDVWEGMFHCWQVFAGQIPEGQEAIEKIGKFVQGA